MANSTPSSRSRRDSQFQQSGGSSTPSRSQRYERERQAARDAPHNEYPLDGMTMYCRPGNMISDNSSSPSPGARPPSSHASGSGSDLTSVSSGSEVGPAARNPGPRGGSPVKQLQQPQQPQQPQASRSEEKLVQKRKSGFFSGGGPFRRKSKSEKEQRHQLQLQQQAQQKALQEQRRMEAQRQQEATARPSLKTRSTWSPAAPSNSPSANSRHRAGYESGSSNSRPRQSQQRPRDERHQSPEPIDPRASLALNVGGNVFDVSNPDTDKGRKPREADEMAPDPIAQALAELKDVTRNSATRNTADRFFGLATPAPAATPAPGSNSAAAAAQRGTPPPGYVPKNSALGLPPPAFTSAQMQETTQRYVNQRDHMLDGPQMPAAMEEAPGRSGYGRQRSRTMENMRTHSRQSSREGPESQQERTRAISPVPDRSVSPRPQLYGDERYRGSSPQPSLNRSVSPNPYTQSRPGTANTNRGQYTAYSQRSVSPLPSGQEVALSTYRSHSPAPSHHSRHDSYGSRSRSQAGGSYDAQSSRHSYYSGDNGSQVGVVATYQGPGGQVGRPRSKSVVDTSRQYSRDGRPIMHYGKPELPLPPFLLN